MPLLKRIRVMAAKIEATIGTPETLTATEGVFNAYETMLQPTIEVEEREGQGAFNRLPGVAGSRQGTATFKTDVAIGSAQPTWASVLLPACGLVESATVYTPRSEAPGSNVKTATIGVFEDGLFKSIAGATGTFQLVMSSGKMAYIEWTFQGVWQPPTDTAIIAPAYPTDLPLRFANASLSYTGSAGAVSLQTEALTLDMGNEIVYREDPSVTAGYVSTIITDRYPRITANPESALVATNDPYGDLIGSTEGALSFTLNGPSSSSVAVSAPKAQIVSAAEADRNKLQVDDLEWTCNKNGATNDQEVSITVTPEV